MSWLAKQRVGGEVWLRTLLFKLGLTQATNARYVTALPHPQNAIDILQGEWRCQLPEPLAHFKAGTLPLFEDERIQWLAAELGGLEDMTVLELGPLEGAHSYILEQAGAKSITAIEANTQAYLKCLIVKELLDLKRVKFLCGDFMAYLREETGPTFDLGVACGVLYHMQNPVELIALLAKQCRQSIFLWTHYYDETLISQDPRTVYKHTGQTKAEYEGFEHTLYRYEYQEAKYMPGFSGAGTAFTHWLSRKDIIDCLAHFGFGEIKIGFDETHYRNGPALALIARRKE